MAIATWDTSNLTMAGRGGVREGAGRKAAFPHKELDRPFGMDFTPAGWIALLDLQKRTGLSRDDILAHLTGEFADALVFDSDGVQYPGKRGSSILRIRLPKEQGDRLRAAQARTGKSYSDLGEALVHRYGHQTTFPAIPGADTPRRRRRPRRPRRRAARH